VRFVWEYSTVKDQINNISLSFLDRLRIASEFIFQKIFFLAPAILGAIFGIAVRSQVRNSRCELLQGVVLVLVLGGVFGTFLVTFPLFEHYGNIFLGGSLAAGVITARVTGSDERDLQGVAPIKPVLFVVGSFLLLLTTSLGVKSPSSAIENTRSFLGGISGDRVVEFSNDGLNDHCPKGSSALVYGWSPEIYAYYDLYPSTRYVASYWQTWPLSKRSWYVARLVNEVLRNPPTCILDASGSNFFGNFSESERLEVVLADLVPFLTRCYEFQMFQLGDGRSLPLWNKSETRCTGL
jgi:hypothetical protein